MKKSKLLQMDVRHQYCTFCKDDINLISLDSYNIYVCPQCIEYFKEDTPQEVLGSFYFAGKIDPIKNSAACAALIAELLDKKIMRLPGTPIVRIINAWNHFNINHLKKIINHKLNKQMNI